MNMSKSFREDLTSQRFGRLTVIEFVPIPKSSNSYWKCKCDCGNFSIVMGKSLLNGDTSSCGCFHKERTASGKYNLKHGMSNSRIYRIWKKMKERCTNTNSNNYAHYGGKGIKICDEWLNDFTEFYNWSMANGYTDELTIDRIDVSGNYCPENCRWVDMKTQQRNRTNNIQIEYQGKKMCLSEVAEKLGVNQKMIQNRYRRGYSEREMLTLGTRKLRNEKKIINKKRKLTDDQAQEIRNLYTPNDTEYSQRALAKKYGVAKTTIQSILKNETYTKE